MPWYLNILLMILKPLAVAGLKSLELKYPGLTAIINQVIALIEGGAQPSQVMAHLNSFEPAASVKD